MRPTTSMVRTEIKTRPMQKPPFADARFLTYTYKPLARALPHLADNNLWLCIVSQLWRFRFRVWFSGSFFAFSHLGHFVLRIFTKRFPLYGFGGGRVILISDIVNPVQCLDGS
ncbi:hypothetical protein Q3G72_030636 [Acer saccharum]|nr:hypothetical protein Q3G72_030636 [Acer saccharum]